MSWFKCCGPILFIKIATSLSQASMKDVQSTVEAFGLQKKTEIYFLFSSFGLWVIFALLYPDPESGSSRVFFRWSRFLFFRPTAFMLLLLHCLPWADSCSCSPQWRWKQSRAGSCLYSHGAGRGTPGDRSPSLPPAKYKSSVQIRAGKAAVCIVTGQEGGHLATDHPHSHLQNIRVAYR